MLDNGRLYVWTVSDSWKVKRVRRNPECTVQPCDFRGKTHGDIVKGSATVLDAAGSERVRDLIKRRYGIMGWVSITLSKVRRGDTGTIGLEIVPA
ncbi:PPOX class F420-dependent enzyme [Nocardia seriolae]|uniref:PPOX class F420-dependent enzyme n=1 Tax=Nocardia seriolae TaxID=37332 RepID=A0ABC9YR51_9NOCA|nr:hypothetical protein NSERKGN1266_48230 [Nocardia seriolae]BEK96166.1 hypothetical protein NSER024013_40720 [Nocardia seriolae]GAM45796.1 F420-dependent protein [Nocardia seriolae]GAP27766.1 PPOX class F420-dependent enzyme [Nocardia seriolae]GEM23401.1 hypothetical protein NS2_16400 [Nocardia seriolae NBRC 15557]